VRRQLNRSQVSPRWLRRATRDTIRDGLRRSWRASCSAARHSDRAHAAQPRMLVGQRRVHTSTLVRPDCRQFPRESVDPTIAIPPPSRRRVVLD
jgi:hypothetical protein